MSALILGSSGQLARHLRQRLPQAHCWGRSELDLCSSQAIEPAVRNLGPTAIINAAAYTAVDGAEEEPDTAWRVNAEAPAAMARVAETLGVPLIHVSTDYVFDGTADTPYEPDARTRPLNVYGRTKLAGELAVAVLCRRHWTLRASWVFSEYGSNFVKTMLRLGAERDALHVVSDQYGRPTYAGDLAAAIQGLINDIDNPPLDWGTYHAVGGPALSWHAFAVEIFNRATASGMLATGPTVHAIPTAEYPKPAPRPLNAVLAPSAELHTATGRSLDWRNGLATTLDHL